MAREGTRRFLLAQGMGKKLRKEKEYSDPRVSVK